MILAVLGILFGAAALATYEGEVLRDPHPDEPPATLPTTALQPEDVAELRFDMAVRGYRMSEVDTVLHRFAEELAARDARIAELEDALSEPPAAAAPAQPDPEPVPPQTFAPLAPPAAAPAIVAGPLTATTWWPDESPATAPVQDVEPAPVETVDVSPAHVEAPEPELEQVQEPAASAPVDTDEAPDQQPAEPEPELEPAAEPEPELEAPAEQRYEPHEPHEQDEEPAALDVPATLPEPPALTLPAADDAFSFPELQLPEPAVEQPAAEEPAVEVPAADEPEPAGPSEPSSKDWWTSLQEPPSGERPDRG